MGSQKNGAVCSYIASVVCVIIGLYKMFAYEPYLDVYIINSSQATSYFVLAVLFAVVGLAFVIAYYYCDMRIRQK